MEIENRLKQIRTERREMTYSWRDMALYALAVGAKAEELDYLYEGHMKAVPSFGTLPYWGTIGVSPRLAQPAPAAVLAAEYLESQAAPLHMDHEIILHRPIDPIMGRFLFQDRVADVYDRGPGKGMAVRTVCEVADEAGIPVCTNISGTLLPDQGGFGGSPMPAPPVQIPEREPDYIIADAMSPEQNLLYRLCGDTNRIHADPVYAREKGYDRPFMQGLCSYGFACRMLIGQLIPGEPERMRRMYAQMRGILYPGSRICVHVWKETPGSALFRMTDAGNRRILDRGVFEWI